MRRALRRLGLFIVVLAILPWVGCEAVQPKPDLIGCVRLLPLEGGCLVLQTADGKTYELYGNRPPTGYVAVWGKVLTDRASICMVGIMFQVESYYVQQSECPQTARPQARCEPAQHLATALLR